MVWWWTKESFWFGGNVHWIFSIIPKTTSSQELCGFTQRLESPDACTLSLPGDLESSNNSISSSYIRRYWVHFLIMQISKSIICIEEWVNGNWILRSRIALEFRTQAQGGLKQIYSHQHCNTHQWYSPNMNGASSIKCEASTLYLLNIIYDTGFLIHLHYT